MALTVKAQYLLNAASEEQRGALADAAASFGGDLWAKLSDKPGSRVLVSSLIPGPHQETLHSAMGGGSFDVSLDVVHGGAGVEESIELGAGLAEALGSVVDADTSAALVGQEYVFQPTTEGVRLIVAFTRPLTVPWDDCHRMWLNGHGWLIKPILDTVGIGYRQFHADPKASYLAAKAAGLGDHDFEGIADGYFESVEAYASSLSDPEVTRPIHEDEARFLVHATAKPGMYDTVVSYS